MLRTLPLAIAVLVLAVPATAQDAEVGMEYEITIETEQDNQHTGPFGQATIGSVVVNVPNAEVGETYNVRITAVRRNQYTEQRQASCEFEQVDGDRKGMCIGAP